MESHNLKYNIKTDYKIHCDIQTTKKNRIVKVIITKNKDISKRIKFNDKKIQSGSYTQNYNSICTYVFIHMSTPIFYIQYEMDLFFISQNSIISYCI